MRAGLRGWIGLAVAVGVLAWAPTAPAGIITQTQTLPIPAPPFTTSPSYAFTDWSYSSPTAGVPYGSFQQFDPTKGTLTAVNITFTAQAVSDITMKFTSASTINVAVTHIVANLHLPNGGTLSVPLPDISRSFTGANQTVDIPRNAPETASTSISLTNPAVLALFEGTGTFFLPIDASAMSSFSTTSGNGFGSAQTQVGVTVAVEFPFVPEPSSLALAGLGGGCLLVFRRFRRRSSRLSSDAISGTR